MKKAELSITVIVVVIIGLLILVLLAFALANNWLNFDRGASCVSAGGVCRQTCSANQQPITMDANNNQVSCTNPSYSCCPIAG